MAEPGVERCVPRNRSLDAVIEEIRSVEGFEQFLAPPTFDDITRAAGPSPLVYFAAANQSGLALVMRSGEVTHVPVDTSVDRCSDAFCSVGVCRQRQPESVRLGNDQLQVVCLMCEGS